MTSYENETQQTSETFDNTIVIMAGTAIGIHRLCGKHRHVAGQYLCDRAAGGDPLRIAGGIGEYSIGTRIRTDTGKLFGYTRIAAGRICNRCSGRRRHISIFPPGDSGILRHTLYRGQWQPALFHRGGADHTVL